jgi:leucyl/phenylalanyl-tRNA--protein transferase
MHNPSPSLPWLEHGDPFPAVESAWPTTSDAPGLLAAGGDLEVATLERAYRNGIFPWFSEGQPILWWSPDPRMVLKIANFRLHRSLRQVLKRFTSDSRCEIRFDSAFSQVIEACATTARRGQPGTWILPDMVLAYTRLHQAGAAHSIETWIDGKLVGGLYCVALGRSVFGESMFAHETNTSKIALSALVAFCRATGIGAIDCQQNTAHLASLGATEVPREVFSAHILLAQSDRPVDWRFTPLYWNHILSA